MSAFQVGEIVEMCDTNNFPNYRMIVTGANDSEFAGVCVSLSTGLEITDMHVGQLNYNLPISEWRGITRPFDLVESPDSFYVGDVICATYGPNYIAMVSEVNGRGGIVRLVKLTGDDAGELSYFPLQGCYARVRRTNTFNPSNPSKPIPPVKKIGDLMAGYGLIMIITDVDTGTFTGTVIDSTDGMGLGVVRYNQPISQFHHTPQGQNDR